MLIPTEQQRRLWRDTLNEDHEWAAFGPETYSFTTLATHANSIALIAGKADRPLKLVVQMESEDYARQIANQAIQAADELQRNKNDAHAIELFVGAKQTASTVTFSGDYGWIHDVVKLRTPTTSTTRAAH